MATWGKCDFQQIKELQERIQKLEGTDFEAFCNACAKELAARLLAKVIKRTPVGDYNTYETNADGTKKLDEKGKAIIKHKSAKKGGTLRRGWTAKTEDEAKSGGKGDAVAWANSLPITKSGNIIQIEITNPVNYASYVEYGHRTKNHKGWVKGQFMLTISEQELDAQAPKILEQKLAKYLGECFNG